MGSIMNHPSVVAFAQAVDQVLNSRTFVLSCEKAQGEHGTLGLMQFLASPRLDEALLEQDLLLQDGDFFHEWGGGQWAPRWTTFEREQHPSIQSLSGVEGVDYLMDMLSEQTPQRFHSPYQCKLTEKHAKELISHFMTHITGNESFQFYTIETAYLFSTPDTADYWDGMGLDSLTAIESQTQWTLIITNGCA